MLVTPLKNTHFKRFRDYAIIFSNTSYIVKNNLKNNASVLFFQDLYEDVDYGILSPQTKIKVKVNPSGSC